MKIKEMETSLRPREKAMTHGLETLSDLEIIALLLQSGNRQNSVFDLAKSVLEMSNDLSGLFELRLEDLMKIKGIKQVKALQLLTGIELCKRALQKKSYRSAITTPQDLARWFQTEIGFKKQEHFVAVYLDTKARILTHKILYVGTLNESCVHPRDIFHDAFLYKAHSLIMVHNHPSGDPAPSTQDIEFTNRVKKAGELFGILLLDHVIVGKQKWFSFKQHQYLD